MNIHWSRPARVMMGEYIDYLHDRSRAIAQAARADIRARTEALGRRPYIGRPSSWPGLRVLSLTRWRKLIVYRVETENIEIVAFLDARGDLSKVDPEGFGG